MKISTKGRYALRLMIDIAAHSGGDFVPLSVISERQGITVKYLEQIVPLLAKGGLLASSRGSGGGYRLTKPSSEYTAGAILRAVEGQLAPVACLEAEQNSCPRRAFCPTLGFWEGLDSAINSYIDGVTLADLVNNAPAAPDCAQRGDCGQ